MKTYFSVGEISKLTNMSIQTLRYYDRMGLLKPAHVNEENNYRYYSIDQFIKIDLLRQCRLIGLSLKEIEKLVKSEVTPESMIDIIDKQKKIIDEKIQAFENVRTYIDFLDERIKETLQMKENEIFIRENQDRRVKRYDCRVKNDKDLELCLRKVLNAEKNNWMLNSEIVFEASVEELIGKGIVVYTSVMLYQDDEAMENHNDLMESTILPKGKYLTMYYDDSYKNNLKYYKMMADYIVANDIKMKGNFNEFCILPRVDSSEEEKTLVQLEVQVE